jgi:hypothetical protein
VAVEKTSTLGERNSYLVVDTISTRRNLDGLSCLTVKTHTHELLSIAFGLLCALFLAKPRRFGSIFDQGHNIFKIAEFALSTL